QGHQASVRGEIKIQDVSFSYFGSEQSVLNHVTLELKAGEKLALLGRTGCGKSTLLQLLTRNWDPQQGEITLDGTPLCQWQEAALRDAV
ncbi:ATP-binding cassette domain-containing protein, partial [Halomonas sp. SIMBA_159]